MSSPYLLFKYYCCGCFKDPEKENLKNRIKMLEIQIEEQKKEIEGYKLLEKLNNFKDEVKQEIKEITENEIVIVTN